MDQPSLSYRPLYQQIKEVLLQRIVSGEWAPGTFIPSESALAKEYQVSVGTLRKALDSLASDNVVVQSLNSLERDLLREALHLVKEFKGSLSHRYHLEYA